MNRILKMALTFSILFSLVAFSAAAEDTAENADEFGKQDVEPKEYAVYSALINATYAKDFPGVKVIVIEERTMPIVSHMERLVEMAGNDIGNDILADYKAKNSQRWQLQNLFKLDVNCVLISKEEQKKIFIYEGPGSPQECQKKPGKAFGERPNSKGCPEAVDQRFYDKFPKSQGIMTLSRVGFNHDETKALVYEDNWCGWLCGIGFYVFLSKENGKWAIQQRLVMKIS